MSNFRTSLRRHNVKDARNEFANKPIGKMASQGCNAISCNVIPNKSGLSLGFGKFKVSEGAKIRNRYNQVPHLTQDTNGKVANSQFDTTNESQEVSPFPAGDHKAHIIRRVQRHSKHKTEKKSIKEPQKKYRLGTVSKIFYWRA